MRSFVRRAAGAAILTVVSACSDPVDPEQPVASVAVVAGESQVAGYGVAIEDPFVVLVTVDGEPAAGIPVVWRVIEGGGTLVDRDTVTDAQGRASARLVTGSSGGQQLVYAEAGGSGVTFRVVTVEILLRVYAGRDHTCALATDGRAWCWGANDWGQLGTDDLAPSHVPRPVSGNLPFTQLSLGPSHTCGISRGEVWCWGSNSLGQLGNGTTTNSMVPRRITSTETFEAVSAGAVHTCAVRLGGGILCWGADDRGQTGGHDTDCQADAVGVVPCRLAPAVVVGAEAHVDVAAGELHTCGRDAAGVVACWGANDWGELGRGSFGGDDSVPAAVMGGPWQEITAGARHTCALDVDGQAWCWGWNLDGALGAGLLPTENRSEPVRVAGGIAWTGIATGRAGTCGIAEDETVWCWGEVRGDGAAGSTNVPVVVEVDGAIESIARGERHACAVVRSGDERPAVWCWGANERGQAGIAPDEGGWLLLPVPAAPPPPRG